MMPIKEAYWYLAKQLHRAHFVSDLLFSTLMTFGPAFWLSFWLTNSRKVISIDSLKFNIRTDTLPTKITDVGMVFETIYHEQYGRCRIGKDDVIIDIGAHIGSFSIYASRLAKKGKVYSFEPFPSTFLTLKKNVGKIKNIYLFNKAVDKHVGECKFYVSDINYAENSLHHKYNRETSVKATTLDRIFKENRIKRCNVLKLDCEGSEYGILFSSRKLLSKIDRIIMEYHVPEHFGLKSKHSKEKLAAYLSSNGFKVDVKEVVYYQGIIYADRMKP
jgi:FkbM family methyltransferase